MAQKMDHLLAHVDAIVASESPDRRRAEVDRPGAKGQVRRVLADAAFEPGAFAGWSTPKTFNEAAAGMPSPAHVPGAAAQQASPSHRPPSVAPASPALPTTGKRPSSSEGAQTWDRHSTAARASATLSVRPKEMAPLHARRRRFVDAGARIMAHPPDQANIGNLEGVPTRRSPALLESASADETSAGIAWGNAADATENRRESSAASDSPRKNFLRIAASIVSPSEEEVLLCAAGFGTSASGKSPFPANTPPLAWLQNETDLAKEQDRAADDPHQADAAPEIGEADTRPATHQSKASVRHVQLDDDALIEDAEKDGEVDSESREQEGALEGILDSPELANRRSMLKEKMHELASHTAHEMLEEVDEHAYEKRAKLIRKRFKLMPWMVRERNMLWFAPPIEDLQGQSLGFFGEWDPIRILCVDLLRNSLVQAAFFLINAVALGVLAVRPAREAVVYEYDVYGQPVPTPYYTIGNIYFVAETIALLTLAFEVLLSVVARGLFVGHYAFVKDPFNVLDAVILVLSSLEYVLWAFGWTFILRGFRVMRMLKPLMLVNEAEGCRAVVSGIRNSLEFVVVIIPIIFVLVITFAAGLPPLFGKHMSRRCVVERTDTQYVLDRFNDTRRIRVAYGRGHGFCQIQNKSKSLLGWLISDDSCPKQANALVANITAGAGVNQVCDDRIGNPEGGFGQVDTIWSSVIAILQASGGDAWQIIPERLAEAEPKWKTLPWIIFAVPAIGCSLFLFPAVIALAARKYYETRLEQSSGKSAFLNVLGNAETHAHHEHHSHDVDEEGEESMGSEVPSDGFEVEQSEAEVSGADRFAHVSKSLHLPDHQKGPTLEEDRASSLKSPLQSRPNSPDREAQDRKSPRKSPLGSHARTVNGAPCVSQWSRGTTSALFVEEISFGERAKIFASHVLPELCCHSAIIMNNVLLVWELQERTSHYGNEGPSSMAISRTIFSIFFMVEVVARLIASGSLFKHFRTVTCVLDFMIVFVDAAGIFAVVMGSARWHVLRGVAGVRLYRIMLLFPASGPLLQKAGGSFAFLFSALAVPVSFLLGCAITAHHYFGEGHKFGVMERFSYFTSIDAFRVLMHVSWGDKWWDIIYGSMQSSAKASIASRIQPNPEAMAYVGAFFLLAVFYIMRFWFNGIFAGVIGECFSLGVIEHDVLSQVERTFGPSWRWAAQQQAAFGLQIASGDRAARGFIHRSAGAAYVGAKKAYIHVMRRFFPYWDLAQPIAVTNSVAPEPQARFASVAGNEEPAADATDSPDYEVFGDAIDTVLSAPRRPPVLGHPAHTSLWVPVLGGLRYKNPIRVVCRLFLASNFWKLTINISILMSSIFVFIGETNRAALPEERVIESVVTDAQTVFTGIYISEFVIHIVAQGLLFPPRAYLREAENVFDFIMLVINVVDFSLTTSSPFLRAILILRLLRLFRPPRPFRNGEGMIYHSVMGALLWMAMVAIFASFLFLIFAVIGMEIFSGQLHSCSCAHIKFPAGQYECRGHGISGAFQDGFYGDLLERAPFHGDGFLAPCSWNAPASGHFDSLPEALLSLMRISGRKWSDLLETCMGIAGRGHQPVPGLRADVGLYFAVFIAISALLIENLITAFMIQGFGRGLHFANVSKEQLKIEAIEKVIGEVRPRFPREWPTGIVAITSRRLIKNIWFRRVSWVIMVVHAVLLMSQYGGMDAAFLSAITYQNHVFFGLLCAETLVVLAAFGPKNFVAVPFHWLDASLIALGAYSYTVGLANEYAFPRILRVFRLFIVILPKNRGLGYINEMFHYAMGMVLQSLALLAIVLVIFSLIGHSIFANVRPGQRLGSTANFDTFGMSIVTMLQIVLGDEWHEMMIDCSVQPPFCNTVLPGLAIGDCGTPFAPSFFLAFKLMVHGLCLNIVIASFIDGLQYSRMKRMTLGPYPNIQIESELLKFSEHWTKFDPGSTGKMKVSIVPSFLLQLPKPLGFGKVSKLQKLSDFQRSKSLAIQTELAIVAGLCDGITAGAPMLFKAKKALEFVRNTVIKVLCFCFMGRKRKKKKGQEGGDQVEVDYEAAGDRFWLMNAGNLGKTYYPAGKVDAFWLNIAVGDTVSYEQVCTAVLAQMIPDYLSPERLEARSPLTRAVNGTLKAVKVSDFCRRCLKAEDSRAAAADKRILTWRTWALSQLNSKIGMIASITAMGCGTWVEVKPIVLEPPKMEAEKELEIVTELINNCEADLKVKDCDEKALTMTLLSLKKRRANAKAQIKEAQRLKDEEARAEEERRLAMKRRVEQLCDQGHDLLERAEEKYDELQQLGPVSSDTLIHDCINRVNDIVLLIGEADEIFDKAIKAGSYYNLRGDADEGTQHGDELRLALETQEMRLLEENDEFRRPLKTFANFVRLENADDFAMIHDHNRQRKLNAYFAAVLLQAYTRRKAERVRFCAISQRSSKAGGRFVPVSCPASLALAPLNENHRHISAQRAGMKSNRIALLRTQQLEDHLGFSIMSPTSPVSHGSPLGGRGRLDPLEVADHTLSPRGLLYLGRGGRGGGGGGGGGGGRGGGRGVRRIHGGDEGATDVATPSRHTQSSRGSSAGPDFKETPGGPPIDFGW